MPGFLAHDGFNLVVGLPILLGSLWLARRGSLIGLLLWPGALFYVLYTYALYVVGAPFSALFLPYVALVWIYRRRSRRRRPNPRRERLFRGRQAH